MTQESVEAVRRSYAALNRGDIDGAMVDAHPDMESDWSESRAADEGVIDAVIHGRDELRARTQDFLDIWDVRWDLEELLEVPGDQVLSVASVHFRGRDGIELGDRGAWLHTFQGGKVVRMKFFPSKERAARIPGAVGVGDVAGERGGRSPLVRAPGRR
jgi:ketosteroid isomerase-like protein